MSDAARDTSGRLNAIRARVVRTIPARVVQRFLADDGGTWAVAIAWGALFALIPAVLSITALIGLILGVLGITQEHVINVFLTRIRDPNLRIQFDAALSGALRHRGLYGLLGVVGLYFSASGLFGSMEKAFAVIYHARPRTFLRQRLMGMVMVVALAFFVGLSVVSSALLPLLRQFEFANHLPRGPQTLVLQSVVGTVAGLVLFGLIYYVVPPLKLRPSQVWPGTLVAGALFEVVSLIFPIYVSISPFTSGYGQFFGLLFVLLTYFYLLGLTTVLGAEVNAVVRPARGSVGA